MSMKSVSQQSDCKKKFCYKDLGSVIMRTKLLKLNGWEINTEEETIVKFAHCNKDYVIPKYEVYVDDSLGFTVRVFGWLLPETHHIYKENLRSVKYVTISALLSSIEMYSLCNGLGDKSLVSAYHHVIPKKFNVFDDSVNSFSQDEYFRCCDCELLILESNTCTGCNNLKRSESRNVSRRKKASETPARLNAPISITSPKRIILAIREHRLLNKQLQENIIELRNELTKSAVPVTSNLDGDLKNIFKSCDERKLSPFMKLFWEEQMKYLQCPSSEVRYHPMVIKYCLGLYAKSPAAYEQMRINEKEGTGVLVLPSQRTLRDYKNYIRPQRGFNDKILDELLQKTSNFSAAERFVILLFDEMKVQEDLVWDKHSNELIGYVDLGDTDLNYATLNKVDKLATHVLVFLVKSLVNPLSYSLATFATDNIRAHQLFPLFWRAVANLELICNLKVIATASDGASPNRTFYRMHQSYLEDNATLVTYKSPNFFSDVPRFLWFFSDAPHLMKTTRNCLSNSGSGRATRYMWNSGLYVLWSHISQMYYEDSECGLQYFPKLTNDHFCLTPFSVMKVKLAVQVLSCTVANILLKFGPPEASETAKFCLLMDSFFDCTNVRNTSEWEQKRKPFLKPYESVTDERFDWLENVFLKYFLDWKSSIENRAGNFTVNAQSKMFISWQTYEGLQITTHSLIECIKFLLNSGVKYVLSEKFCQDDVENYFGRQRAIGRRRDNPTVRDVGYNDNTIKSQISIAPLGGNITHGASKWNNIDETPLPKRKKDI